MRPYLLRERWTLQPKEIKALGWDFDEYFKEWKKSPVAIYNLNRSQDLLRFALYAEVYVSPMDKVFLLNEGMYEPHQIQRVRTALRASNNVYHIGVDDLGSRVQSCTNCENILHIPLVVSKSTPISTVNAVNSIGRIYDAVTFKLNSSGFTFVS